MVRSRARCLIAMSVMADSGIPTVRIPSADQRSPAGAFPSLMLFKADCSANRQVGRHKHALALAVPPCPRQPNRLHDLSRLASGSCIRWPCCCIDPGHEVAKPGVCSPLHPLISRAKLAYRARLMQFPRVGVDGGGGQIAMPQYLAHLDDLRPTAQTGREHCSNPVECPSFETGRRGISPR